MHAVKWPPPKPVAADALEGLYRQHHEMILRTAYRLTRSMGDAEDVLHGLFVRLMQREKPLGDDVKRRTLPPPGRRQRGPRHPAAPQADRAPGSRAAEPRGRRRRASPDWSPAPSSPSGCAWRSRGSPRRPRRSSCCVTSRGTRTGRSGGCWASRGGAWRWPCIAPDAVSRTSFRRNGGLCHESEGLRQQEQCSTRPPRACASVSQPRPRPGPRQTASGTASRRPPRPRSWPGPEVVHDCDGFVAHDRRVPSGHAPAGAARAVRGPHPHLRRLPQGAVAGERRAPAAARPGALRVVGLAALGARGRRGPRHRRRPQARRHRPPAGLARAGAGGGRAGRRHPLPRPRRAAPPGRRHPDRGRLGGGPHRPRHAGGPAPRRRLPGRDERALRARRRAATGRRGGRAPARQRHRRGRQAERGPPPLRGRPGLRGRGQGHGLHRDRRPQGIARLRPRGRGVGRAGQHRDQARPGRPDRHPGQHRPGAGGRRRSRGRATRAATRRCCASSRRGQQADDGEARQRAAALRLEARPAAAARHLHLRRGAQRHPRGRRRRPGPRAAHPGQPAAQGVVRPAAPVQPQRARHGRRAGPLPRARLATSATSSWWRSPAASPETTRPSCCSPRPPTRPASRPPSATTCSA